LFLHVIKIYIPGYVGEKACSVGMEPGDFDYLIVLYVQDHCGAALVALAANTPVPGLVVLGAGLVNPVPENILDRYR
jgi:hypothetical protein